MEKFAVYSMRTDMLGARSGGNFGPTGRSLALHSLSQQVAKVLGTEATIDRALIVEEVDGDWTRYVYRFDAPDEIAA